MSKKTIHVLVFEPGRQQGYAIELLNTLEAMQHLVADGGLIETCHIGDCIYAVMDEEGKNKGKRMNRPLKLADGRIYDIIAGTCFLTRSEDGEFTGLEEDDIAKWSDWPMATRRDIEEAMSL